MVSRPVAPNNVFFNVLDTVESDVVVFLIVVIGGLVYAARRRTSQNQETSVALVTRGTVKNDIELTGTVISATQQPLLVW